MANILTAIQNLLGLNDTNVGEVREGNNRANNMGDAFETYIKNIFAGVPRNGLAGSERQKKYEETFSYCGNSSNPPDAILRGGDAIEIKKLETKDSQIQLNSSFPKNKLHVSDSRIANNARIAEEWTEKDLLYIVGNIDKTSKKLRSMWWVYGDCFCADSSVYTGLSDKISSALRSIPDVNFSPTNELGRINSVDLLAVTDLRIRGMWLLKNPHKIFGEYAEYRNLAKFQLFVLMMEEKWKSFPIEDREKILKLKNSGILDVSDELVPDPNQPARSIRCKLIKYAE